MQERYQRHRFSHDDLSRPPAEDAKIEQGLTTNPNWIAETSAWIEEQF